MNSQIVSLVVAVVWLMLAVSMTAADLKQLQSDFYVKAIQSAHPSSQMRNAIADCMAGKFDTALPVLRKLVQDGDLDARFVMAKLYSFGLGVEPSKASFQKLLRTNVESSHVPSMVVLADLIRDQSPPEALQLYSAAAQQGDIVAAIRLGDIYEVGKFGNVQANPKLAIQYFEMAAKANNAYATFRLGKFHEASKGVSPNHLIANQLFKAAAMRGHAAANTSIAHAYLDGKGVEPDPVAAIGWLTRGAQAGDTEAMVMLAQHYEKGESVKQDLNIAGQLYSSAAKANDVTGKFHLARLYYEGIGTKPDIVRAFVLLSDAQSLPKAKSLFDEINEQLTPEQKRFAAEKIQQQSQVSAKAK